MEIKKIGILGGGQLGYFLARGGEAIGVTSEVLDPERDCPASSVAKQTVGSYTEYDSVKSFGADKDILTFETENANAKALEEVCEQGVRVEPSPKVLRIIKDKLAQKNLLKEYGLPVGEFQEIHNEEDITRVATIFGYPFVLKVRSGGYDGKGNFTITNEVEHHKAFEKLGGENLYAEKFVSYDKELAVIVVRAKKEVVVYPVVETKHVNHVCDTVIAPAQVSDAVRARIDEIGRRISELLPCDGALGIEFFLSGEEVLINEIAPRVHNSAHYTLDACETSQFENHMRAVCEFPLGNPRMKYPYAVMVNLLGKRIGESQYLHIEERHDDPNIDIYIYGKKDVRIGRKMGHVTVVGTTVEECIEKARAVEQSIQF